MSIDFAPEKKGGLSELERNMHSANEAANEEERAVLRTVLNNEEFFERKWAARDVLTTPKVKEVVAKYVAANYPTFRYKNLERHLRYIATNATGHSTSGKDRAN